MRKNEFQIHQFAIDGDIAGIVDELAKGVSVEVRDPSSNRTPLMEAAASSKASLDLIQLLIHSGANVNAVASTEKYNSGETALSLAAKRGNLEKVRALLDAAADIHYERPSGYDVLIDATCGGGGSGESCLVPMLELLISRGAKLNGVSTHNESALSIASRLGRFDAIRVLLNAGADPAPLQWTELMREIALGSLDDVKVRLNHEADLSARDRWSRTPWLLSLQTGDIAKAKLLLAAGADRSDKGRCGKTPLMYPIISRHPEMLRWLLSEGFNPDDTDEFGTTPLIEAAEEGATECVRILIDGGANIYLLYHSEAAIKAASNLEIVRMLVNAGADLNDISDEMRAELTKLPQDGKFHVARDQYLAEKLRRFGKSNPEKMDIAFWRDMITSGASAYTARRHFDDTDILDEPPTNACLRKSVWCFARYGKSINELPDGRIIEIAGEHEGGYDPDFCIYNDVIVHHGDGTFDIYGYPKELFPPTDFHSATLVKDSIYIVGSLGYTGSRKSGETQVYRLDVKTLHIEKLITTGESPGWINRHKAYYRDDGTIEISGGKVCFVESAKEKYQDNSGRYRLDLDTLIWLRVDLEPKRLN